MLLAARENAQRCAVDCAPYMHATLQAVQHEHRDIGRYIISERPLTEEGWARERAIPGWLSTSAARSSARAMANYPGTLDRPVSDRGDP